MFDPSGSSFNYANVIFAVLQDCEHRRRSFSDEHAADGLTTCARDKLARIRQSYLEGMGSKAYWRELEHEVLDTVVPQYIPAAIEQNRKERDLYGIWRGGDPVARFGFALAGLFIGILIIALPFIPAIENVLALAFALGGWFCPDLIRMTHERRHYRLLNRLVTEGEEFQRHRARYLSSSDLDDDDEAEPLAEDRLDAARRAAERSEENRQP
jgi:hypothetical protein